LSTHIFNLSTVCAHCTSNKNQHALMLFNGNRLKMPYGEIDFH